jgi:2-hydroxy-3-keto-5-methylthiopentenyl-1-phosphate phosphatase
MARKHYLLVSDFDQTLSFNDSGHVMSDMMGISNFGERVAGLSRLNLVQSGAELTYLILHDPEFRRVRRDDLVEVGRRIRLKRNIALLTSFLENGIDGHRFEFYVVSAAPEDVVHSALAGIVPPERIIATRFVYDERTGEVASIARVPAGYGKVAAVDELRDRLGIPGDRIVYVGDGSSDVHVMLHVNNRGGYTIAVSENRQLSRIARRTVLSDDAFSVMVPILEQVLGLGVAEIRTLFESNGLTLKEWEKARTDRVIVGEPAVPASVAPLLS